MSEATVTAPGRDKYIDFLRAFSLLVVVAWHWVFTIVIWHDDGPHTTSPIGFTTGLWTATALATVDEPPVLATLGLAGLVGLGLRRRGQMARRGDTLEAAARPVV